MKDIMIDCNVMRLYPEPKDRVFGELFAWIYESGALVISSKLLQEFMGQGKREVGSLLNYLQAKNRLFVVSNKLLKEFDEDKHFKYSCNTKDHMHAKAVFLSNRKKCVSLDDKFVSDINRFPKVNKIKPEAVKKPNQTFYV